jgi:hypothetical protein
MLCGCDLERRPLREASTWKVTPSNGTLPYLLSILGVVLFVVGIGLQVLTFRKRRPVRPVATWVGQAASLLAMATYSVIVARPPGPIEWMTLLVLGGALGWFYGRLVKVERVGEGVVMSYTLPWLLVWGAILATTQLVSIASGRVPVVLYAAGILSAGLNAGMHARVLGAARKLPDQAVVAALLMLALGSSVLGGPAGRAEAYTLDQIAWQLRSVVIASGGELVDQKNHEPEDPVNVLTYGDRIDISYATRFGSGVGQEGYSEIDVYWFRDPAKAREQLKWVESDASDDPRDPVLAGISGNAVVKFVSHSFIEVDSPYRADQFQAVLSAVGSVDWEGALTFYNGDAPPADDTQPPADTPGDDTVPVPGDGDAPDPGTSGTSVSDDDLLAWLADFYANKRVPIGQQAAATNTAGGVLAFGSLLQLLLSLGHSRIGGGGGDGGGGAPQVARLGEPPLDPLAGAARSTDGRVYFRAPWDEAGAAWMSEADARRVAEMESQGYRYSNRWGWVSGGQEAEYEAARSRAAAAARTQDPELAAIEQRIRDARAGIAAARSEQQRIARIGQLWENQRVLEKQMAADGADAAHWDRIATGANVVKGTADLAVNVLGTYGGPLGRGVRIGYNYTSGLAEGYGNYLAEGVDDPSQLAKHLMVGHATGLVKAGATEAIDYGASKALGAVPGVVNYLRGVPRPGPVPPSLLTTQAALKQLTDPKRAVAAEHVLKFVNGGGMQKVAQLEALGHAPAGQVQSLVKVVTAEVDGAVTEGAKQAYGAWNRTAGRESGVRVARVLVGDAGSSSSGALRSAATDADRTFWAVFEKNDLAAYAAKNGVSEAEAAMQLNKAFAGTADDSVQSALKLRNIDPAKVDYKTYSGFGRSAGPADTYPTGDALVRQAVGGRTTVVSQTAEGGLQAYRSSGQTLTDEYLFATGNASAAPRIATAELGPLAQRQVESIAAHTDVKSVAKALTRLAYVDGRSEVGAAAGGRAMDPLLKALAQQVRSNPQEAANILRRAGLSEAEFRDRAFGAASDIMKRVGAL